MSTCDNGFHVNSMRWLVGSYSVTWYIRCADGDEHFRVPKQWNNRWLTHTQTQTPYNVITLSNVKCKGIGSIGKFIFASLWLLQHIYTKQKNYGCDRTRLCRIQTIVMVCNCFRWMLSFYYTWLFVRMLSFAFAFAVGRELWMEVLWCEQSLDSYLVYASPSSHRS